jgi:phospholipid/cholesterol/gamma-HCH transport system substrate-binding protein
VKNEIKVGFFGLATFVLMFLSIIWIGKCSSSKGSIPYKVQFGDLDDLKKGALVKFAGGLTVGYVKSIYRNGSKAELLLWISKDFKVTKTCTFIIRSAGMLGEKYVQLNYEAGDKAPKNHIFQGANAASLGSALVSVQEFIHEAKLMLRTFNAVLGGGNPAYITNTTTSLAGVMKKLNDILGDENIKATLKNLSGATESLKTTVLKINSVIEKINTGEGTLGALITDKQMKKDFKELIKELKEAVKKIKNSSLLGGSQPARTRW